MEIFQFIIHYSLHFLFPGVVAYTFFRKNHNWKIVWLIMALTILVDLDHLIATPIFDPTRCSIGFHPLHSYYAIGIYFILAFFPRFRIIMVSLLLHMATDYQDCLWM